MFSYFLSNSNVISWFEMNPVQLGTQDISFLDLNDTELNLTDSSAQCNQYNVNAMANGNAIQKLYLFWPNPMTEWTPRNKMITVLKRKEVFIYIIEWKYLKFPPWSPNTTSISYNSWVKYGSKTLHVPHYIFGRAYLHCSRLPWQAVGTNMAAAVRASKWGRPGGRVFHKKQNKQTNN